MLRIIFSWLLHRLRGFLCGLFGFFSLRPVSCLVKGKNPPIFPLQGCNLLPYRHLHALRRRAWRRSEFALAACVGLSVASLLQYHQSSNASRAAQNEKNWQRKLEDWQPQLAESQRLHTLIATHQRRMTTLANLIPEQLALTTLLNQLAHFHQATVSLTQLKMESDTSTISGIANDYAALSDWVQSLKQTGKFSNVEVAQVQQRMPLPNTEAKDIAVADLAFSVHLNAASKLGISRPDVSLSISPKMQKKMPTSSI